MKRWLKLVLSMAAIAVFIKGAPLVLTKIEMYRKITDASDRHGIDNNTVFYSDEPISYRAEQEIKEKLK